MRVAFGIMFVLASIFLFSFAAVKINGVIENKNADENAQTEFSTFTSAVCNSGENFVQCKDELFVSCNGTVSKSKDIADCNGFNLDSNKINGFAVFEKEWKDPRANQ